MDTTVQNFKCKTCGAGLDEYVAASVNGLVECPYCRNVWTIPRKGSAPEALQFLRMGEHDLDTCKFDDAFDAYKHASEVDKSEPEAYYGMALAEFKVQYLKDETADPPRMQPICHEISDKKFTENKYFKKAVELATEDQKKEYLRKGEEITRIRTEFYRLKESGLSYDCFLCVKVSDVDESGHKVTTQDSHEALKLYHYLRDHGYSPFYSEEEIKNRTGVDYEAFILYALYSAGCMLIVCSDEEYLRTKWVKNEYTRFSRMIETEQKEPGAITFVFKDRPIEHLPGRNEKIQGISLLKPDAYSRIEEYIASFHSNDVPLELKRKEYTGAVRKKQTKRLGVAKRELEGVMGAELSITDQSKVKLANDFLARKDFVNGTRFIENMLKENASNSEAYWLRFLAGLRCSNEKEFIAYQCPRGEVLDFSDFEKAIACAQDPARRAQFYKYLYKRVMEQKELRTYQEYIELPDSKEKEIGELTEAMYRLALQRKDERIFGEIIKTVTDTDKYVSMNLEFAHAIPELEATKFYKNILTADEGHGESLWRTFFADHNYNDKETFSYCCSQEGLQNLENALFAYGFNQYANEKLYQYCLANCASQAENATRLFDFVLTMIPKQKDKIFLDCLNGFIMELFRCNRVRYAGKYNEYLLNADKLNHNAYFNRVMIKHNYHNAFELVALAGHLLEDEDYFSALNSFTEQHPNAKSNLYLDINDAVTDLASFVTSNECRKFIISNCFLTKEDIPGCKKKVQDALSKEASKCLREVCKMNGCKVYEQLFELKVDITGDPRLKRAYELAKGAHDSDLEGTLGQILRTQSSMSQRNAAQARWAAHHLRVEERTSTAILVLTIIACISTIVMFASLVIAMVHPAQAFLSQFYYYYAVLFDANGPAIYGVGIAIFGIVLGALTIFLGYLSTSARNGSGPERRGAALLIAAILVATMGTSGVGVFKWVQAKGEKSDIYVGENFVLKLEETDDGEGWKIVQATIPEETDAVIVLPTEYAGKDIVEIGRSMFSNSEIAELTLPEHLEIIRDMTFYGCHNLKSIRIPASVTRIEYSAFENFGNTDYGLRSAYFEVTTGWKAINESIYSPSTTNLDSSRLSDPSTAALWLKSTHAGKTWVRGN